MSEQIYCYNDLKRMCEEHDYERWKINSITEFMEEQSSPAALWHAVLKTAEPEQLVEILKNVAAELNL